MAGGDRNKVGNATDLVYHLVLNDKPVDDPAQKSVCGQAKPGIIVSPRYPGVVTCKKCLAAFVCTLDNQKEGIKIKFIPEVVEITPTGFIINRTLYDEEEKGL